MSINKYKYMRNGVRFATTIKKTKWKCFSIADLRKYITTTNNNNKHKRHIHKEVRGFYFVDKGVKVWNSHTHSLTKFKTQVSPS